MARDKKLLKLRDNNLKLRFLELVEQHPEWKLKHIKEKLSLEFYLSVDRIEKILSCKKSA